MPQKIVKEKKYRKHKNILINLFIIFSSILIMNNSVCAADLGLIEADQVHDESDEWIIIDARPESIWQKGHIPGAHSLWWENFVNTGDEESPFRILPPEKFAAALGAMGISKTTSIAVYGDAGKSWGGEGWACWVLIWLGHEGPVRLLNGGIQAWTEHQYPVTSEHPKKNKKPAVYEFQINQSILIHAVDIQKDMNQYQLIDTRSTFEWLKGHLPKAVHISWKKFYKGKNRIPLTPEKTIALLRKNGIDTNKPIVYYCSSGLRCSYPWMVHELAGLPTAINFDGGMADWESTSFR